MKGKSNNGKPFVTKLTVNDVPTELNWRLYGKFCSLIDYCYDILAFFQPFSKIEQYLK